MNALFSLQDICSPTDDIDTLWHENVVWLLMNLCCWIIQSLVIHVPRWNERFKTKREVRKVKQEISMTDQVTSCTLSRSCIYFKWIIFQDSSNVVNMIVKWISPLRAMKWMKLPLIFMNRRSCKMRDFEGESIMKISRITNIHDFISHNIKTNVVLSYRLR